VNGEKFVHINNNHLNNILKFTSKYVLWLSRKYSKKSIIVTLGFKGGDGETELATVSVKDQKKTFKAHNSKECFPFKYLNPKINATIKRFSLGSLINGFNYDLTFCNPLGVALHLMKEVMFNPLAQYRGFCENNMGQKSWVSIAGNSQTCDSPVDN
jgi:hypothetical protein